MVLMLAKWPMIRWVRCRGRLWLRSLRPLVRFVTGRQNFPLIILLCLYINLQITVNEYYIHGLRVKEGPIPLENRSLSDFIGTQCTTSKGMKEGKRSRRAPADLKNCVYCHNASRLTVREEKYSIMDRSTKLFPFRRNCRSWPSTSTSPPS